MNTEELEQNLDSLSRALPDDPNFVPAVLSRLAAESIEPPASTYKRWIMRSSLGLAATLLIALSLWSTLLNSPRPAYAIEDLTQRMLALDSIHIKGLIFPAPGLPPQPVELFVQQPDKIRVNGHADSGAGGPTITDLIINSTNSMTINPAAKTATITRINAEDAKAFVAQQLQGQLQSLFGAPNSLKKIRDDQVNNTPIEVYENKVQAGMRLEVWFNPVTGLPVQTMLYIPGDNQSERLAMRWDTIQANPKLPDDTFTPTFPSGWTINYPAAAAAPADDLIAGSQFGNIRIDHRYLISLNNGDLLLCWSMFDPADPAHDLNLTDKGVKITIKSQSGISYTERLLHADPRGKSKCHWRWSLLHPQSPESAPQIMLSVTATDRNRNSNTNTSVPTTYRAEELEDRIQALQRLTLPTGQSPMTLKEMQNH